MQANKEYTSKFPKPDDFMDEIAKKGKKHKITATGDKPAIRLAVSRADVNHIYDSEL